MNKFHDRLKELGFDSYPDYLKSPHWADFKCRYAASGRPTACVVCSRPVASLHHHTYVRLGREEFEDVVPLCRGHHRAVHDLIRSQGGGMSFSREAVSRLKGIAPRPTKTAAQGKSFGLMMRDRSRAGKRRRRTERRKKERESVPLPMSREEMVTAFGSMQLTDRQKKSYRKWLDAGDDRALYDLLLNIRSQREDERRKQERREEADRARRVDEEQDRLIARDG